MSRKRGYIRERPPGSGHWQVQIYLGRTGDGKPRYHAITVHGTRDDAEAELFRLLREVRTGQYVQPSSLTLGDFMLQWLEAARPRLTGNTYEGYHTIIRAHIIPAIGSTKLAKLSPHTIQGYYSRLQTTGGTRGPLSARTVLHHHRLLHRALADAVRWGLIPRNPCDLVEPPRPQRPDMTTLTTADALRLLQAATGTRLYIPVLLALSTGMRRSEILALRWSDIDLQTGHIHVSRSLEGTSPHTLRFKDTKSGSGRLVPLPQIATDALRRHREEQARHIRSLRDELGDDAYQDFDLVCCHPDGRPIVPNYFSQLFRGLTAKAGISITFHGLRHSHATFLLTANVHPKIVQERLGHSTISITLDTYSHVVPSLQEEAARHIDAVLTQQTNRDDTRRPEPPTSEKQPS